MKYMSFNSSCSYTALANMLEAVGVETDDRTIALTMQLPFLFAKEEGEFRTGPMLQSAGWFNLYLNPLGFALHEKLLPAADVPAYLMKHPNAMLGLQVPEGGKHAVVCRGGYDGMLLFINSKQANDDVPELFTLTAAGLSCRLDEQVMVAALEKTAPRPADIRGCMQASSGVIRDNVRAIDEVCCRTMTAGALRRLLNPLFRALLLDGVTMLGLLGEEQLAARFTMMQDALLQSLRVPGDTAVRLGEQLSVQALTEAAEDYISLIERQTAQYEP